ncbi:MAG: 4-(cytidine 5'-diphospho)-2-C-methyl-D-erythritol kinase [Bacteroidales bacterium]|nr:4-(cytidine 5'-diphospho)-2-C-methyl-D-erythritol kinase [Bacteroidales bacterium]
MIVFPNAKINLGLNILKKRIDGYHDIQSVFLPIDIKDALEVVVNKETEDFIFTNSGLKIDAPTEKNLVVKAYKLLKNDFNLPPVSIHLHKVIPFGAGLGGGSADASFMFKLMNEMFNLNLSFEQLENYARQIGADCAFFIKNKPAIATGIGDILQTVSYDFSEFIVVVVKPDLNLNTAKVYSYITPNEQVERLNLLLDKPTEQWKNCFFNDFEKVIFSRHPQLEEIKNELYKKGASYAAMSGSGSSIFGLFNKNFKPKELNFKHQSFWSKILNN